MATLFVNCKAILQTRQPTEQLVPGEEMKHLPVLENAFLLVEDGLIKALGPQDDQTIRDHRKLYAHNELKLVDVGGRYILPTWCDSHTHLVFAGTREGEFVDRINGLSYAEIAARGGGILNSAKRLRETSEDDLYRMSAARLRRVIQLGTGAIEIKSGYGLTKQAELKMLRVIRRLKEQFSIPIKATFLGAHALPADYQGDKSGYLDLMINEVLPVIAEEGLADYVDVFCEKGYFDLADTRRMLQAGIEHGLSPKIHVNQFNAFGGVQLGVDLRARSVDHLEQLTAADVEALQGSQTMPVALPGCSYFLGIPYTPARRIIAADLPLALASDYNPGSAPSGNMNFVVAAACINMKMTPEEAINAATLNGAYAMDLEREVGSITIGKRANFMVTQPIDHYHLLPYSFGANLIESVYINGELV
ncbi:MAG: imidazolonepropionase [Bacteroidota bacterium]